MATKIKLMRLGKKRAPYYRIVVADARTKRDGRSIETIGKYHPKEDPSFIEVDSDRAQYWLGVGAQPTESVAAILRVTGDWQRFKGEPAPEPMLVRAPKADKRALFEAASKQSAVEPVADATTPKKKAARPAKATAKAEAGKADVAKADVAKADVAKDEAAKAEAPAAEAEAPAAEAAAPEAAASDTPAPAEG